MKLPNSFPYYFPVPGKLYRSIADSYLTVCTGRFTKSRPLEFIIEMNRNEIVMVTQVKNPTYNKITTSTKWNINPLLISFLKGETVCSRLFVDSQWRNTFMRIGGDGDCCK